MIGLNRLRGLAFLATLAVFAAFFAGRQVALASGVTSRNTSTAGVQVITQSVETTDKLDISTTAACPPGTVALSGGGSIRVKTANADYLPALRASAPIGTPPTAWTAASGYAIINPVPPADYVLTAFVVCGSPGSFAFLPYVSKP